MKSVALAALAACLLGGGAALAQPLHSAGEFHGAPGGFHGGPGGFHGGPGHWGGPGFGPVGYHHWGYGEYLPRAWLIPSFYVADYVDYDLAAPPVDYQWIRDGADALLVNVDTGMVVQVVSGAFA